ncbi:MAG: bifunctional oligoribonuclease/PAP phosphatase NrnA [Eubacteriales bacterium]|nr:bifunctional oligoribonuclease/PAP phosphatase NrnA [Eubacteriales bacterium]
MITNTEIFKTISEVIERSESIVILPHVEADGDALGSSIALGLALSAAKKSVMIVPEEDNLHLYRFLPGLKLFRKMDEMPESNFTAIALDTGDFRRLGSRTVYFEKAEATINVDHHTTNTYFAQHNIICDGCSSTGEIIFKFLEYSGVEIDKEIAEALYVAITTDTGGFRYSNTTSETHIVASRLLEKGIDVSDISKKVFDTVSKEKVLMMGEAIKSLKLLDGGKLAVITITYESIGKIAKHDEDTEGLVNIGRNIDGVEVSVLFKSTPEGKVKVNLRSNEYVDVSKVASHFSGGGHIRASGCIISGELEDVKVQVINKIREQI